jgi:hypothetical protein
LGRYGHDQHTLVLVTQFENREFKRRGDALLSALKLRHNPDTPALDILLNNARSHEERMEIAGRSALELAVTRPADAVATIGNVLFAPGGSSAWRWGHPRIRSVIGFTLQKQGHDSGDILSQAIQEFEQNFRSSKFKLGWHYADMATNAYHFGFPDYGNSALQLARTDDYFPDSLESRILLQSNLEGTEIRQGIKSRLAQEHDGFFPDLWRHRNADLFQTFGLFRRSIDNFARSGRRSELEQICEFVWENVSKYDSLDDARDCCDWAGEFAAQLAASLDNMPPLIHWVNRFYAVCTSIAGDPENHIEMPDSARRAVAIVTARNDFERGVSLAVRIGDGQQMSKALRDIARDAVRRGGYEQIQRVCESRLMVHGRSEHLADIAELLAEESQNSDQRAIELMRGLLVDCSDYPDAAYRAAVAAIRFFNPGEEASRNVLDAVAELDRRASARRVQRR